jgi:hypothetical protein
MCIDNCSWVCARLWAYARSKCIHFMSMFKTLKEIGHINLKLLSYQPARFTTLFIDPNEIIGWACISWNVTISTSIKLNPKLFTLFLIEVRHFSGTLWRCEWSWRNQCRWRHTHGAWRYHHAAPNTRPRWETSSRFRSVAAYSTVTFIWRPNDRQRYYCSLDPPTSKPYRLYQLFQKR